MTIMIIQLWYTLLLLWQKSFCAACCALRPWCSEAEGAGPGRWHCALPADLGQWLLPHSAGHPLVYGILTQLTTYTVLSAMRTSTACHVASGQGVPWRTAVGRTSWATLRWPSLPHDAGHSVTERTQGCRLPDGFVRRLHKRGNGAIAMLHTVHSPLTQPLPS